MTKDIHADLMFAILAMDSYNQGYGAGGKHGKDQIGSAKIKTDSTDEFSDPNAPEGTISPDQAAGFYAVAYELDGETVISYRSTDAAFGSKVAGNDIVNGNAKEI